MTTTILAIPELANGQTDQYITANEAFDLLEKAGSDFLLVDLSAGNAAVTAAEYRAAVLFRSDGNTVARDLTLQAIKRLVVVENNGTAVLSVIVGSTTITIGAGSSSLIYTDGTANGLLATSSGLFNNLAATAAPTTTDDDSDGYTVGSMWADVTADKVYFCIDATTSAAVWAEVGATATESFITACSDDSTEVITATGKGVFFMPYAFTVTEVIAGAANPPTGSVMTLDINEDGTSILSTKITIDDGESTSVTAATPPVISDASIAKGAKITVDFDGVGSTFGGAGIQVTLVGYQT